jgi:hypothetical protein
MDKEGSATKCPLCGSQESADLDRYPGSFVSRERLVECLRLGVLARRSTRKSTL